ncbi:unnamed protein product [Merluccius merluccius]
MAETLGLWLAFLTLLGSLPAGSCTEANVTCTVHEDCLLPCSFRPSGTVVIHWYKQQTPVHSYYYNRDQFGLQNKHFSGRTGLFNAHILQGNASLLLRRVKVQDKGRYKCYTSTRKGNQEMFVNLALKAVIQSVTMEMGEGVVSCSSQNIYPAPGLTWTTDPASSLGSLPNVTMTTVDHRGLFSIHSSLLIGSNLSSDHAYFCSVASADRSQVWTASWKNQEDMVAVEDSELCIPCVAPQPLLNFSLTWSFSSSSSSSSSEPGVVLLRYDSRSRESSSLWEGRADLDPDRVLEGDGSLRLHGPDSLDQSGTYVCTFSALHSRHTVQTRLNVTTAPQSVHQHSEERSWWCTVSSVAFVFTIIILLALPQCLSRQRVPAAAGGRSPASRPNGSSPPNRGGAEELLNVTAVHISGPHSIQISIQHLQTPPNQEEAERDKPGSNNLKPTNGLPPHHVEVEEDASVVSIKPVTLATIQETTTEVQDEGCGLTEKMILNQ